MGKLRRPLALVSAALSLALGARAAQAVNAGSVRPAGAQVPVRFTPNQGQLAPGVLFQARTPGMVASVLADGLRLDLAGTALRLRFAGADAQARAEGCEPCSGRAHFFSGSKSGPGTTCSAPTFARVRVLGLYPGVDLELYERDGRLEYDLVLAPGADERDLELVLEGADAVAIDAHGALCATLGPETFRQLAPLAWQVGADGRRAPLTCAWRALDDGRFGFALGARAPGGALVIDPVLVYGTTVGGSNADSAASAFVDEQGCVYVTGWSRSLDFPATDSAAASGTRGKEAVVFKLAPDGQELLYACTFGGRGDDEGIALQVNDLGEAIVVGNTQSDDFPTTPDVFDRRPSGGADAFVLKFSADGARLLFSTLLGGSAEDVAAALALTGSQQITVAGTTRSRDFPVSSSSYATEPRGGRDAFVARLDPDGQRLLFSTRLGGCEDDEGRGLAVDGEGCSYVTGETHSHDFPTTLGALDRERCGVDAFVAKLSGGGRTLLYSTFLGGSGQDEGRAIAVDAENRAVVVGWTQSLDFPFDAGKPAKGRKDGFAVRLTDTGNALLYATPIGGGSADEALGLALDPLGDAWIVGRTRSADLPLTRDAHQGRMGGAADAFLVRLSRDEGVLRYATFLGGAGEDELCGVHADRSGTGVVLCGMAAGIPLTQRGALSGRKRGPSDAFVLRFDPRTGPLTHSGPLQAGIGF